MFLNKGIYLPADRSSTYLNLVALVPDGVRLDQRDSHAVAGRQTEMDLLGSIAELLTPASHYRVYHSASVLGRAGECGE